MRNSGEPQPLTLFSVPKAFKGNIDLIQRNAIQTWLRLRPQCEIILLGNDPGTAEVAAEFGVRHIPQIARNEYGTPLLNSAFGEAEKAAANLFMCYVNADIIFMSDFMDAVQHVLAEKRRFLLVGRRWDLDLKEHLSFTDGWEAALKSRVSREGKLHGHSAVDYFVFPRGLWEDIPPFAIGRTTWDGWLIYRATSQRVPVIDLTETVTIVHQVHEYPHALGQAGIWKGPEAQQNLALAGGYGHAFTAWDAKYRLTPRGIRFRLTPYYFYRLLVSLSESYPGFNWLLRLVRYFINLLR